MQTALIQDFHYSTKESDYWLELPTVTKMLLLQVPSPCPETEQAIKKWPWYKRTTHFCPGTQVQTLSDSSVQGNSRATGQAVRQLPSAAPFLTPS